MKQHIRRFIAFALVFVLLCPAAGALSEDAEETAATETPQATEKPKVSAAELQNQGILVYGAKGEDVKRLQQRLKELGYLSGAVDGAFGGGTKRAVIAFQRRNGLTADGEAGQETQAKLYAETAVPAPQDVRIDVLAGSIPMLVNKEEENMLDEFFVPDDLVKIRDVLGTKLATIKYKDLQGVRTAVEALKEMLEAAREDGIGKKWQIADAYRTWDKQNKMLTNRTSSYKKRNKGWSTAKARRAALQYVAEPGASEHHLGLAFDVNKRGASSFAGTKHAEWLNEHCWEYGFIIRYQEGKEEITGFKAEPWHIRYVGVEHAMYMKEHDLCLEEYVQGLKDGTIALPGSGEPAGEPAAEETDDGEPAVEEVPDDEAGEDAA